MSATKIRLNVYFDKVGLFNMWKMILQLKKKVKEDTQMINQFVPVDVKV